MQQTPTTHVVLCMSSHLTTKASRIYLFLSLPSIYESAKTKSLMRAMHLQRPDLLSILGCWRCALCRRVGTHRATTEWRRLKHCKLRAMKTRREEQRHLEPRCQTNGFVSAETSVRSPWNLFSYIINNNIYEINEFQRVFRLILKSKSLCQTSHADEESSTRKAITGSINYPKHVVSFTIQLRQAVRCCRFS